MLRYIKHSNILIRLGVRLVRQRFAVDSVMITTLISRISCQWWAVFNPVGLFSTRIATSMLLLKRRLLVGFGTVLLTSVIIICVVASHVHLQFKEYICFSQYSLILVIAPNFAD